MIYIFLSFFSMALSHVEFPEGCLTQAEFPCSVRAVDQDLQIQKTFPKLFLQKQSSILLQSQESFKPLEGVIWLQGNLESKGDRVIAQKVGLLGFEFELTGEWLIEATGSQIKLQNLQGEIVKGSKSIFAIPAGFENWISLVNSKGILSQGIPKPFDTAELIKALKPLMKLSNMSAVEWQENKKLIWKVNQKQASEIYRQAIEQTEDLQAQAISRREEKIKRTAQEKQKIRELFRLRAFAP